MPEKTILLNASSVQRVLTRMAHEIAEKNEHSKEVALVGVQTGGIHLARRLVGLLSGIWGHPVPVGTLDVSMHRDDVGRQMTPDVHPTEISFDINGKTVVLVDDVLFSGRTTRAALDALNDLGRPRQIQLAVLVDRGHRELPIKADFVGKNVPTSMQERIDVQLEEATGRDSVYLEKAGTPRP
jgi:pyrimidine operon attenuation protein / uracil phosphoribosyltransferase